MKATVLGGTGFVGSWIVRELVRTEQEVVAVGHPSGAILPESDNLKIVPCDFTDVERLTSILRGSDVVFHAGGYYPVYSIHKDRQIHQALAELQATLNAVRRAEAQRFVFTSSPLVHVDNAEALRRCTYHALKRALHDEVLRWTDRGLPSVIIIPGACFGPGDWKPTTGRFLVEIANRRMRFVLEGIMNAVDVRDVARGQVSAWKKGTVGTSYQMGGWNGSCGEFTSLIAEIAGVPSPSIPIPYELAKTLAIADEWIEYGLKVRTPLLPQAGLDMAHYGAFLDSTKARRELGFTDRPIRTTISDTLEDFAQRGLLRSKSHRGSPVRDRLHV